MRSIADNARTGKILGVIAGCMVLGLLAFVVAHGTHKTFAIGVAVALAIPLCYLALQRPMLFPFGVYAALVPFNDILSFGHLGTINGILGMLALAAVLFMILRKGEFARPSPAMVAWLAVCGWMGLSGLWAIDPKEWQGQYLTFFELFALYAVTAMSITTKAELRELCTCVVTGGMAAAAVALWPALHGNLIGPGGRLTLPGSDPSVPVDPNQFAAGLLLPFAILFATTLGTRKLGAMLANTAGLGLIGITIVLTGSRAAMLALAVLVMYTAFGSRRRLFGFAMIGLGLLALIPFAAGVINRWSTAIGSGGAGRTDIWSVAIIVLKEHWLVGTGLGSFPAAFNMAMLKAPLQAYVGWSRAPHDLVVGTLVELGVVGFALVILALALEFRDVARLPAIGGFLGDLRIGCAAALLAICTDALFLDVMIRKYLWLIFIMIALVRTTILGVVNTEQRRRLACARRSSLIADRTSMPERLSA